MAESIKVTEEKTESLNWAWIAGLVVKALILFVLFNLLYALLGPLPAFARISVYNRIVPGRERLPFGENPAQAYNLSLFSLEGMIASHEIVRPKADDEFRVIFIGDSSVWGTLLRPEETVAGQLDALGIAAPGGKTVRAYNLGYPTLSLAKDLMILERVMPYQPDLIVWLVTLESMPRANQLRTPLAQNNPETARRLIAAYDLDLDPADPALVDADFLGRTIWGERREIADLLRLNLYGFAWAATGVDQFYPESYPPLQVDFEADATDFYGLEQPLNRADLALDILTAGHQMAGDVPVLLVNEPMFISGGENSDIRYNFYYPRRVYDQYRAIMADWAAGGGYTYLDLWDFVPPEEFTNSAIHITPEGTALLAQEIAAGMEATYP
jgi:hypothetical protein